MHVDLQGAHHEHVDAEMELPATQEQRAVDVPLHHPHVARASFGEEALDLLDGIEDDEVLSSVTRLALRIQTSMETGLNPNTPPLSWRWSMATRSTLWW